MAFFNKVAGLIKKRLQERCFSANYAKFLVARFSEHLWATASEHEIFDQGGVYLKELRKFSWGVNFWHTYSAMFVIQTTSFILQFTKEEEDSEPCQTDETSYEDSYQLSAANYLPKKFHIRCLTGFWIPLCIKKELKRNSIALIKYDEFLYGLQHAEPKKMFREKWEITSLLKILKTLWQKLMLIVMSSLEYEKNINIKYKK